MEGFSRPEGAFVSVTSVVHSSAWLITGLTVRMSVSVVVLPDQVPTWSQGTSEETDQRSGLLSPEGLVIRMSCPAGFAPPEAGW